MAGPGSSRNGQCAERDGPRWRMSALERSTGNRRRSLRAGLRPVYPQRERTGRGGSGKGPAGTNSEKLRSNPATRHPHQDLRAASIRAFSDIYRDPHSTSGTRGRNGIRTCGALRRGVTCFQTAFCFSSRFSRPSRTMHLFADDASQGAAIRAARSRAASCAGSRGGCRASPPHGSGCRRSGRALR